MNPQWKLLSQCHFSLCDPPPGRRPLPLGRRLRALPVEDAAARCPVAPVDLSASGGWYWGERYIESFALALDDQILYVSILARADGQNHEKRPPLLENQGARRKENKAQPVTRVQYHPSIAG